ncbi:hypothetical protein vBAspATola_07 [Aeromonas phage vB_AspA_Tola]|nr:hypothetical protein vBAspATola_07 [Aeromonas phage vB_AspA_Tola]
MTMNQLLELGALLRAGTDLQVVASLQQVEGPASFDNAKAVMINHGWKLSYLGDKLEAKDPDGRTYKI